MHSILLIILFFLSLSSSSEITLDSLNKFDKMLVHINDDVAEGDGTLLENIKKHLTKASKSLWNATGNMQPGTAAVQFGTVYIRVPRTWNTPGDPISWQQCNKADFLVTTHRDNNNQMEPITKQLGKCGEKGENTRFSELFFLSKNEKHLENAGKIMMTEFVKLRYGVFSEKPLDNVLTYFNGTTFINGTCGANIDWTLNKPAPICSDKNKICKYFINPNQRHNYSVMFDSETPTSEYFCNDNNKPHNRWAKSLHNNKCNRSSISSVILKHEDFKTKTNSQPLGNIVFKVIKGQNRLMTMVLDVSGSMNNIIDNMRRASVEFISKTVEESARVGLVKFSDYGIIVNKAIDMNKSNKKILIDSINGLNAGGWTNIADGIAKGIEALGGSITSDDKMYGTIILLSDGGNNKQTLYTYDYAINQAIKKSIIVNVICYGNLADPNLNQLAKESGGQYYFVDPNAPYSNLMDKFAHKQDCEVTESQKKMMEGTRTIEFSGRDTYFSLAFIDQYIGMNLTITVMLTVDVSGKNFSIIDPNGKEIATSDKIVQTSGTTFSFIMAGIPEYGLYKLKIKTSVTTRRKRSTLTIPVTYRILATPMLNSTRIINPTGQLSSSEIETLSDQSTITVTVDLTTCGINEKEDVTVNLQMVTPSNKKVTLSMMDDGLGDDNIAGDKIYTRALIAKDISEVGFYSFIASASILNTETKETISRTVDLGSLRVKNGPLAPIKDKVPPAKIEDVTVIIVSSEKKELNIKIMATGNDGMIGNISDYEIKITSSKGELIIKKNEAVPPKTWITFRLSLSKESIANSFEVSIRGIDDSSNAGEWSPSKFSNWDYNDIVRQYEKDPGGYTNKIGFSSLSVSGVMTMCIVFVHI